MGWLHLVLKLGRMKMTVFSAVTYGAAASLSGLSELDSTLFVAGWAFVFFTQMVAHFLGELGILMIHMYTTDCTVYCTAVLDCTDYTDCTDCTGLSVSWNTRDVCS